MTSHAHDPVPPKGSADLGLATVRTFAPSVRPRWLLPIALGAIVAGGLVAGGFLSLSTVLYAGLIGGMLLMHMGGHGHGGHGRGDEEGGGTGVGLRESQQGLIERSARNDRLSCRARRASRQRDDGEWEPRP